MSVTQAEYDAFLQDLNSSRKVIQDVAASNPELTATWVKDEDNRVYLVFQVPEHILDEIGVYDPTFYAIDHGHEMVCADGIHRAAVILKSVNTEHSN